MKTQLQLYRILLLPNKCIWSETRVASTWRHGKLLMILHNECIQSETDEDVVEVYIPQNTDNVNITQNINDDVESETVVAVVSIDVAEVKGANIPAEVKRASVPEVEVRNTIYWS